MEIDIQRDILGLKGQCVNQIGLDEVKQHLWLRWETVKNIDKAYLEESLPALDPTQLTGLKYLGVDEVARAKGHDYMTVIYDMVEGHLIGVETGHTADVFSGFLKQLPAETTEKIEAVELMLERLEAWCRIAEQSTMLYLKKFAKSLRNHRVGICNSAKHKLTSARIEAGNISIGMIRMLSGDFLRQSAAVLTDNLGRKSNLIPGAIDGPASAPLLHRKNTPGGYPHALQNFTALLLSSLIYITADFP